MHDGGLVSQHLFRQRPPRAWSSASTSVGGDFTLPDARPRRILFVSGGSGITPVMSMLRTLRDEGSDRDDHLHPLRPHRGGGLLPRRARRHVRRPGPARLHPRPEAGDLTGYFDAEHLAAAMPDAATRCSSAVRPRSSTPSASTARTRCPRASSRRSSTVPTEASGGTRRLRRQRRRRHRRRTLAARAGRGRRPDAARADAGWASATPAPAARPAVRSRTCITGAVSTTDEEDVQICVIRPRR